MSVADFLRPTAKIALRRAQDARLMGWDALERSWLRTLDQLETPMDEHAAAACPLTDSGSNRGPTEACDERS